MRKSEDYNPVTQGDELLVAILGNLELLNLQLAELVEKGNGKVAAGVISTTPPRRKKSSTEQAMGASARW